MEDRTIKSDKRVALPTGDESGRKKLVKQTDPRNVDNSHLTMLGMVGMMFWWLLVGAAPVLAAGEKAVIASPAVKVIVGQGYDFPNNGKIDHPPFAATYLKTPPPVEAFPRSPGLEEALEKNNAGLAALSGKSFRVDTLSFTGGDLQNVGKDLLASLKRGKAPELGQYSLHQIKGEDGRGNVQFTGYFTPLLDASLASSARFPFPLYRLPTGLARPWPTRAEIDHAGGLAGQGLELAFTADFIETCFLHVQGSGLLRLPDGTLRKVGCSGGNGYKYVSIGRILVNRGAIPPDRISLRAIREWLKSHPEEVVPLLNQNPSYTFFAWKEGEIFGSPRIPLVPHHSIAVDPRVIPYGACLLAAIPILSPSGTFLRHEWRILFAHDSGSAIKGPGHVDIYFGTGHEAGNTAGDLHHYGRLWLILPTRTSGRK